MCPAFVRVVTLFSVYAAPARRVVPESDALTCDRRMIGLACGERGRAATIAKAEGGEMKKNCSSVAAAADEHRSRRTGTSRRG